MIKNNRFYWSHLQTNTATVRVQPRVYEPTGIVFSVGNMIDLGRGRQTVMLDPVEHPEYARLRPKDEVAVPFCMGRMDFLYTSHKKPVLSNVNNLLSTLYKKSDVERIVVDVLAPGDLLVFEQEKEARRIKMIDCLRIVRDHDPNTSTISHAL